MPVTTSGMAFLPRPPRRPPFFGSGYRSGTYLGFNPFLFGGCSSFVGLGFGCGALAPFYGYGIGYAPAVIFPPEIGYPSGTAYPSDPIYTSPDPSATLQYTPLPNQYSSLESLPGEDVTASNPYGVPLGEETLLYLKDGSVFAVAGYSVSNGRLRYRTAYGEKNELGVDELDIQKTIQANAERGMAFTLTPPAENSTPGASQPTPLGPAPAPEGPITVPKF